MQAGELQNKPQMFRVTPANACKEIIRVSPRDGRGDAECEWLKVRGACVGVWGDKCDCRLSGVTGSHLLRKVSPEGAPGCPCFCFCSPGVVRMQMLAHFPAWVISFLG